MQAQRFEGFKGFIIGNRHVISASSAVKIRVLWADRREIQSGGDGVRFFNLPVFGLHHRRFHTEINAHATMF
ncbi:Uncharacterised protein [Shigella flexneri]|nr:Uncharacterised protein [Shigella flexneri]